MLNRKIYLITITMSLVMILSCATSNAPNDWLPTVPESNFNPYGGWIETTKIDKSKSEGEFLAVDSINLHILTFDGYEIIALSEIEKATVEFYDPEYSKLASWTTGGTLGSLSHGLIGIITIPVWVISGSLATGAQSRAGMRYYPNNDWEYLKRYARYPGGMPDNFTYEILHLP